MISAPVSNSFGSLHHPRCSTSFKVTHFNVDQSKATSHHAGGTAVGDTRILAARELLPRTPYKLTNPLASTSGRISDEGTPSHFREDASNSLTKHWADTVVVPTSSTVGLQSQYSVGPTTVEMGAPGDFLPASGYLAKETARSTGRASLVCKSTSVEVCNTASSRSCTKWNPH